MEKEPKIPTKEERAAEYKKLSKLSKANRFKTMFGQPLIKEPSPALVKMNKELEERVVKLTAEQARKQAKEHLKEASRIINKES